MSMKLYGAQYCFETVEAATSYFEINDSVNFKNNY